MNAVKQNRLVKKLTQILIATTLGFAIGAQAEDVIKIGVPVGLSGANSVVAPSVVQSAVTRRELFSRFADTPTHSLTVEFP